MIDVKTTTTEELFAELLLYRIGYTPKDAIDVSAIKSELSSRGITGAERIDEAMRRNADYLHGNKKSP